MPDAAKETMEDALNDGQLDPGLDDGPTPTDEDSGESEAGGPTPDSGPTDSDEVSEQEDVEVTSEEEDETLPEEEAEEQLEDEEEEADVADDQDQDSEDSDEEEEEEDEFYFEGEHSKYKSEKEAKNAIDKKDELIYRYRDQLENERQQRQEAESQVESLKQTMPEDQQKELLVRNYMQDELGEDDQELLEMSDEELESNPAKKERLIKARARAEARLEEEIEKAEQQQKQQIQQRREKLNEANEFVTEWVTEDKFNAHSSEDRIQLKQHFEEVPDGEDYNRAERAVLLYSDYGRDVAKHYLEGIRQDFIDERQEAVEKVVEDSDPEPKSTPQPSSDGPTQPENDEPEEFESDNPFETMTAALG
jgi:hypothetical protein